jgi:Family of unknown function (DUF6165)
MTGVRITVSPGELVDRLTILEVRLARLGPGAHKEARRELLRLGDAYARLPASCGHQLSDLRRALRAANEAIWEAEDGIRVCMQAGEYGALYVAMTRRAHEGNDERSRLKAEVNRLLGAAPEIKSYPPPGAANAQETA